MKIRTQRFIDYYLGRFVCRILDFYLYAVSFIKKKYFDLLNASYVEGYDNGINRSKKIKGICIILLSEMGSLTLTPPMIELLEKRYPDSEIYILAFKKNIEIVKILSLVKSENILSVDDSNFYKFIVGSIIAILKLRIFKIDTTIDCELFSRVSSIFSFLSGAEVRVGFHPHTQEGLYRGNHINRKILYNPYLHMASQFIGLAEAVQGSGFPINKRDISTAPIEIPEYGLCDSSEMKEVINTHYPKLLERPLVIINPGGGLIPIRAWPINYYAETAAYLVENGFSVAITGLSSDEHLAKLIIKSCKELIQNGSSEKDAFYVDMTGFTKNVGEFLDLLGIASLLITNDGGPGHFAGITSTPAIVIYGPETPELYGCLNKNGVNLYARYSCSPCLTAYNHRNSPCDGDNRCLKSILPSTVIENAMKMLSKDIDGFLNR